MDAPRDSNAPPRLASGTRVIERVLVVDDEPDAAEMLAELLATLGYEARFALDGTSALVLARQFVPQLLLLDVTLPDMDGYELARRVRGEPQLANAVLVAVTGWSGADRERKARDAGFDHYLVKPLQPATLQRLLGR